MLFGFGVQQKINGRDPDMMGGSRDLNSRVRYVQGVI